MCAGRRAAAMASYNSKQGWAQVTYPVLFSTLNGRRYGEMFRLKDRPFLHQDGCEGAIEFYLPNGMRQRALLFAITSRETVHIGRRFVKPAIAPTGLVVVWCPVPHAEARG